MSDALLVTAFLLLAAHWVADYPLQGEFLATAKRLGPMRVYHLVAHAGIQGAGVILVTGSLALGLAEWLVHTVIDEAKNRGWTSFAQDQALHMACKAIWIVCIAAGYVGRTA